ncbi:unnamed protein product [Rhizoctonia solani]|uniref:Uncharacterized protein n=1 Tax=Rhizoctonia solani TaxID=456999 RepID=A0A8H3AGJ1_9AGAM|nr:unnamed protein product [Rhizoctonia solani]
MAPATPNRKMKTFPEPEIIIDEKESVVGEGHLSDTLDGNDSDEETLDDSDSDDAPEAESLSGGRAAADARAGVLKRHEEKLQELRKTKNKAREEFIRSTKIQNLPVIEDQQSGVVPDDVEGEGEDSGRDEEDKVIEESSRPGRLPDSVFAAAHESIGRKRAEKPAKKDVPTKRRRIREIPAERVVDGRTLRLTVDVNAPPAISSSSSTRKAKNLAKGGSSFRRKWKKVDVFPIPPHSHASPVEAQF